MVDPTFSGTVEYALGAMLAFAVALLLFVAVV
jgi:hypothetical protein